MFFEHADIYDPKWLPVWTPPPTEPPTRRTSPTPSAASTREFVPLCPHIVPEAVLLETIAPKNQAINLGRNYVCPNPITSAVSVVLHYEPGDETCFVMSDIDLIKIEPQDIPGLFIDFLDGAEIVRPLAFRVA